MNDWLKVEFHCHTLYSRDSLSRTADLLKAAKSKGIDRLIVTDHNSIQGALEAKALDPERIIVGEEILTERGELLAAFVSEEVPRGLPPKEAIRRLREQGAFISVSHPFDLQRHGWELPDLLEIAPLVDAIEVFNSRCTEAHVNELAQQFALEHNLAGTVGSDAHAVYELGRATLTLPPFNSADELRAIIREGQANTTLSSPWVHWSSTYARMVKSFRRGR